MASTDFEELSGDSSEYYAGLNFDDARLDGPTVFDTFGEVEQNGLEVPVDPQLYSPSSPLSEVPDSLNLEETIEDGLINYQLPVSVEDHDGQLNGLDSYQEQDNTNVYITSDIHKPTEEPEVNTDKAPMFRGVNYAGATPSLTTQAGKKSPMFSPRTVPATQQTILEPFTQNQTLPEQVISQQAPQVPMNSDPRLFPASNTAAATYNNIGTEDFAYTQPSVYFQAPVYSQPQARIRPVAYTQPSVYPDPRIARRAPPAYGNPTPGNLRRQYCAQLIQRLLAEPGGLEAIERFLTTLEYRPQTHIALQPREAVSLDVPQRKTYNVPPAYQNGKIASARLAKSYAGYNADPSTKYPPQRAPQPWGPAGPQGHPLFSYTTGGEWKPGSAFTAAQLGHYIEKCPRSLTIWIQNHPAQRSTRTGHDGAKCRWEGCPVKARTIMTGWHRVVFDEFADGTTGGTRDPYIYAGSMHLWCYEQCFDPLVDYMAGRLQGDDRVLPHEMKNAMAINRDTDKEIMREVFHPWFASQNGVVQMLPREHNETLSRTLVDYHIDKQPITRQAARERRNARHPATAKCKTNDIHRGDLKLACERTPAQEKHLEQSHEIRQKVTNAFQVRMLPANGARNGVGLGLLNQLNDQSWNQATGYQYAIPNMAPPQARKRRHDEVEDISTDPSSRYTKAGRLDVSNNTGLAHTYNDEWQI